MGRPKLCAKKCATCIFRPGNLMNLRPGRVKGMVEEAVSHGGHIVCHDHIDSDQAQCRGFYDSFGHLVNLNRIVERLGGFEEVG